jgi:allantoicase
LINALPPYDVEDDFRMPGRAVNDEGLGGGWEDEKQRKNGI